MQINLAVPKIFSSLTTPARYKVFHGGRGSAKSHSVARVLIALAMAKPIKILCARELQNSITESVHSLLEEIIINNGLYHWFKITKTEIVGINGSHFIFKGLAHNIDAVKSTEGIDICWIEEADKVSRHSWDILLPTIRKPNSEIWVTFNPTFDDDPVYQMFVIQKMPDSIVQEVNYHDNPAFPDVLRREMEHMKETDYDRYLHVWEGQLRSISDAQVFKGKYSVEEFSSEGVDVFYHGMDFGFAKDPSAIIRCFITDQNLFIDREAYGHHVELSLLKNLIMTVVENRWWEIKADGSRPETISFLKAPENGGWNISAAKKYAGSVEDGVEYLRSFKKIVIHPRCKNAIEEFRRYSYKVDKRTNEILPIILDDYNHVIDAVRYSIDNLIKGHVTIYSDGVL